MIELLRNLNPFKKIHKDTEGNTIIDIKPLLVEPVKPKPKIEHLGETDLYITIPPQETPLEKVGNVYRKYDPDTNETLEIYCLFYPYRINYDIEIYENCKKLEMISTIKGEKVTINQA